MARVLVVLVLSLAAFGVVGCSMVERDPEIVDGWAVGGRLACDGPPSCDVLAATARDELDRSEPGHAEVVAWAMHGQGYYRDHKTGSRILATTSGSCCSIWLASLADGRTVAVGVGYPGISKEPVATRLGPALTFFDLD